MLRVMGLLALCAVACTGVIEQPEGASKGGKGPGQEPQACTSSSAGAAPLRLLSEREWERSVVDLLGVSRPLTVSPSTSSAGFENDVANLHASPIVVEEYLRAAEDISEQLDSAALVPCDGATVGERECARQLAEHVAPRAFRRPLAPAELETLMAIYDSRDAAALIQAILVSPHFLYHVEIGVPVPDRPGVSKLTDWEIASRLSYFLWGTLPDETLRQAASAGRLASSDGIRDQAERMLDDPRARDAARRFHSEWLELDALDGASKDPVKFPEFTPELKSSMREQTERFVERALFEGGTVSDLFVAETGDVDQRLAALYGLPALSSAGFSLTVMPPERRGLLTHASILSIESKPNRSSPIHRGELVRRKLLCQPLPPPPNNVPPLGEPEPGTTLKDQLAAHRSDPSCSGCHQLMDPIGFGFEHYDAIGRFRSIDDLGQPVDATGEVVETEDADGPFEGVAQLSARLAGSREVGQCVVRQWFRWALGRHETGADECTIAAIDDAVAAKGHQLREIVLAIVISDAFRFRVSPQPEVCP